MDRCPYCAAQLSQPSSCAACHQPIEVDERATPFDLFALEPRHDVDVAALRKRLLAITRDIHPDFFATSTPDVRERAERNSARLNKAFEVLSDETARADWLVTHLGGPDEQTERAMPQAFLMEVLEWNETLEEARAGAERVDPRLDALEQELRGKRDESTAAIRAVLTPLPPRGSPTLRRARQELNAIRYVDRALNEIESLRLARAARR